MLGKCDRAGIRHYGWHKLRHFSVVHSDLSDEEKKFLFWGNKKSKMVSRYSHATIDSICDKMDRESCVEEQPDSDPLELVDCHNCGVKNHAGRHTCHACGEMLTLSHERATNRARDAVMAEVFRQNPGLKTMFERAVERAAEKLASEGVISQ